MQLLNKIYIKLYLFILLVYIFFNKGVAYSYMADPAQKADVIKLISETTDASAEIAQKIYEFYFEPPRGIMPKQAAIDMQGMTAVIEMMGRIGVLKGAIPDAGRFVDLQYLKAAGFQ